MNNPIITKEARAAYKLKAQDVAESVVAELMRAKMRHPEQFVNGHEGYAVMLEEVEELWEEVRKKRQNYNLMAQREEAIQIAAMAIRYVIELVYDAEDCPIL